MADREERLEGWRAEDVCRALDQYTPDAGRVDRLAEASDAIARYVEGRAHDGPGFADPQWKTLVREAAAAFEDLDEEEAAAMATGRDVGLDALEGAWGGEIVCVSVPWWEALRPDSRLRAETADGGSVQLEKATVHFRASMGSDGLYDLKEQLVVVWDEALGPPSTSFGVDEERGVALAAANATSGGSVGSLPVNAPPPGRRGWWVGFPVLVIMDRRFRA